MPSLMSIARQIVQNYMMNVIRAGGMQKRDIITQAINRAGLDSTYRASVAYEYGKARDAVQAADIMRKTHNRTPLPSEIGPVNGDASRSGQYRFEVLTQYVNQQTGEISTVRGYVYSNTPLSLQSIRRQIENNPASIRGMRQSLAGGNVPSGQWSASTTVIDAGRVI